MSHPDALRNGFGVASLILGVIALVTCWLMLGVPFGVAAVVTGDIGRRRAERGEADNLRIAVTGMILGVAGIVAGLIVVGYFAWLSTNGVKK